VRSFLSLLSLSAAVPSHSHKNVGRMFKDQWWKDAATSEGALFKLSSGV
jgi:hypothetical protein